MNSTQLIGVVQSSWDNYKTRNHIPDDSHEFFYLAYYNGWLEGRMNMLFDDDYFPVVIDSTIYNIKVNKINGVFYISNNDINKELK